MHAPRRPFFTRYRTALIAVAAVLPLLVMALTLAPAPLLRRVWPEGRVAAMEAEAERALAAGHLTSPEGGARELYEAALALDPDRPQARAGLRRVGEAALQAGEDALAARRFAAAHDMLALARAVQIPRERTDDFAERLRRRQAEYADIAQLVHAAGDALEAGDALQAARGYARVLQLEPAHPRALEGREDALADLLRDARAALTEGSLAQAAAIVEQVRGYDPGHVDLPAAEAAVAEATARELDAAGAALAQGRLELAADRYQALRAIASARAAAELGLETVARRLLAQARREVASDRPERAASLLDRAEATMPGLAEIARVRASIGSAPARTVALTPHQRERLQMLLAQADAAARRGDLLSPPGESAFDRLRAARALAPQDPRVTTAWDRLRPEAQACFESELLRTRLVRARHCLDAWQMLAGDVPGVRAARARLAQRWVAHGEERLRAGEISAAVAALGAARELDPGTPGAAALAERLRTVDVAR